MNAHRTFAGLAGGTALALVLAATPGLAEQKAHVHGSGTLNIAIEKASVKMELIAPGADIVGFEHDPKTDEDRARIDKGVDTLKDAGSLFSFPSGAGCELAAVDVESGLLGDDHDDHDHGDHKDEHAKDDHDHGDHKDEHAKDDHDHGDHKDEHAKDDHDHGDHKDEHAKDDHDHGDHKDEHAKDDHDHEGHAEHAGEDGEQHAEFHATYTFACADPGKVTGFETTYFDKFPGAERLQVQAIGDGLQKAMELKAGAKKIELGS